MKFFSIYFILLALILGYSPSQADCGKGHTPHRMNRIANISFPDMDRDKSGGVSFDEFKAVFPNTRQEGFNMLDKDVDNQLNEAEWDAFKKAHKGMGNYKQSPETT
jgi:hypothetical protein